MILVDSQHRLELLLFLPVEVSTRSTLVLLKQIPGSCSKGGGSNSHFNQFNTNWTRPPAPLPSGPVGEMNVFLFTQVRMNSGRLKEKQKYEFTAVLCYSHHGK